MIRKQGRTSHWVFVLINQILGHILHHQLVGGFWHPSVHKASQVEKRVAIETEFIVDELVSGLSLYSLDD
jgi:hypothetical protein